MEATFRYSGNAFFNKYFIRLVETNFLSSGNSPFFLLVEAIIGIRGGGGGAVSKKELIIARGQRIFWLVETNFFSNFQRLLPVKVFFPSSENDVSRKSFIPASGNGF